MPASKKPSGSESNLTLLSQALDGAIKELQALKRNAKTSLGGLKNGKTNSPGFHNAIANIRKGGKLTSPDWKNSTRQINDCAGNIASHLHDDGVPGFGPQS